MKIKSINGIEMEKKMEKETYEDGGGWSLHLMGGNHQDKC